MPDNELHQFWFTWDEIDFIRRLIHNNAEFEDDENEEAYFRELANKIEDQIVNHNDND
jgi:hypothetical protein